MVLWRARGRGRRQDGRDRFSRNRQGGRFLPQVLPGDDVRGRAWLDRRKQQQGLSVRADLLHQQRRIHSLHCQEGFSGDRQGNRPGDEPERADRRAFPYPGTLEPFDLHPHARREGGEGLPGLADGSATGRRLVRHRRQLLCTVPAHVRRREALARGAAQPALSGFTRQLPSAWLAGADQSRTVGKRCQIRRGGHVRQGMRREVHQERDRRRQRAAQADLQGRLMAGSSPVMSASAQSIPVPTLRRSPKGGLRRWTEREAVFSWLMIIPPALFLVLLVGYPLVYGIWLSLESRPVAKAGTFVGMANFIADWHDPVFWQVTWNTFVYTFAATILK